jgi:RNA polymerase sigma-70 factor, ECF subfamily
MPGEPVFCPTREHYFLKSEFHSNPRLSCAKTQGIGALFRCHIRTMANDLPSGEFHSPRNRDYAELRPLDDLELMDEVKTRNGDALAVLFDRYQGLVRGVALRILRDQAESEDVLQNIFLEIYQRAGQFDPARGRFIVWLLQYAYHRSIQRKNYLVVRQFYVNVATDELSEFEQGRLRMYAEAPQECARFVREALTLLTEPQRRTIEMVHFEGLNLRDVAERTDQSFSNVRHHYYRGMAKLKEHLRSVRRDSSEVSGLGASRAEA